MGTLTSLIISILSTQMREGLAKGLDDTLSTGKGKTVFSLV